MTLAGHKHLTTTQRVIDVNDAMPRRAVEVLQAGIWGMCGTNVIEATGP